MKEAGALVCSSVVFPIPSAGRKEHGKGERWRWDDDGLCAVSFVW